jgi:hypothetical protein
MRREGGGRRLRLGHAAAGSRITAWPSSWSLGQDVVGERAAAELALQLLLIGFGKDVDGDVDGGDAIQRANRGGYSRLEGLRIGQPRVVNDTITSTTPVGWISIAVTISTSTMSRHSSGRSPSAALWSPGLWSPMRPAQADPSGPPEAHALPRAALIWIVRATPRSPSAASASTSTVPRLAGKGSASRARGLRTTRKICELSTSRTRTS